MGGGVAALQVADPETTHVEFIDLGGALDLAICDYAALHDFVIVTKDEGYCRLVALRNFNPKLIGLVNNRPSKDGTIKRACRKSSHRPCQQKQGY